MAIGIAAFVVLAIVAAVVIPLVVSARGTSAASCQQAVPAGASPEAAAYLNALNTGYVGWTRVSRSLQKEHDAVHLDDLINEDATDKAFVARVDQIRFTGAAAGTAQQYSQVLTAYTRALDTAINQYGYYDSAHEQFVELGNARAALAPQLRLELGLPPARCSVLRP